MSSEIDRQLSRANEVLDRSRERRSSLNARARKRHRKEIQGRLTRVVAAVVAVLVAAMVAGWVMPLGIGGTMLVVAALVAVTLIFGLMPISRDVAPEQLAQVSIAALPIQTEEWLDRQRPALPAPAMPLLDSIGVRLETLSAQLQTLNEQAPAAAEIRKLIGEQLPELVKGYQRVPENLRTQDRFGQSPNAQLVDGLSLIDTQIAEMSGQLAQGDLDALATRGRYLQVRYRGDDLAD